jgi:ribonuclease VapC
VIVVDSSAILAVLFNEPSGPWFAGQLESNQGSLLMSTVNLTEVLIHLRNRLVREASTIEASLFASGLQFIPPTIDHARQAAAARLRYPLNLGDCFAYALSATENCPIMTQDGDFQKCDRPILFPPAK